MADCTTELPPIADPAVKLVRDERGLALVGEGMELRCDLTGMLPRIKPGKLSHELLVKAAKVKGADAPRAIDATAGFGEDALLLAATGFDVQLYEADPVIAALLADGLARAASDPQLAPIVARMHLTHGDSVTALKALAQGRKHSEGVGAATSTPCSAESNACHSTGNNPPDFNTSILGAAPPDVIYLDPMFPARQKSAAVKKKFQLLHHLEAPCANEEELLLAAIAAGPRKVVIKRPIKGPLLAGIKPSYSISGKAVRYDCITPASIKL